MRMNVLYGGLLASVLVGTGAGCGGTSGPYKVEGIVKLDGKPVSGATVMFEPLAQGGHGASGFTGTDGAFRLTTYNTGDGALAGEYKVMVKKEGSDSAPSGPINAIDAGKMMAQMGQQQMRQGGPAKPKLKPGDIPASYGDFSQTPLRVTVPPPGGKVILDLKSTGG
jgi:hypothetical protein